MGNIPVNYGMENRTAKKRDLHKTRFSLARRVNLSRRSAAKQRGGSVVENRVITNDDFPLLFIMPMP
jgi:hypothetical protein